MGSPACRVLYTWQLLCLAVKVGNGWANSCPGCMSKLRKRFSHLLGGSFLAGKASWGPSGCLPNDSADYCMVVNEWVWLRSRVCLLSLKVHLVDFWSQSSDRNEDMVHYRHAYLKVVSSETNLGVKGLKLNGTRQMDTIPFKITRGHKDLRRCHQCKGYSAFQRWQEHKQL